MNAASAPVTFASPALWALARQFIVTFVQMFGPPDQLAAEHALTAATYKQVLRWLRAAEALMRRVLLVEAAHYAKPTTSPPTRKNRTRVRKAMSFVAENPEAWRVSFRCFEAAQRPRSKNRRRNHGTPRRFFSAWPLAERAEALLRAFNNPEPYAKRLARRLHAAPHRAQTLLRYPDGAPDVIGRDSFAQTIPECEAARKHFEPG